MFSPACSWASSHRTWPASSCNSTSRSPACSRRVKDPSVYMTLSGWGGDGFDHLRPVPVLQYSDTVVLEDHRVEVRVCDCRVLARQAPSWDNIPLWSAMSHMRPSAERPKSRTRAAIVAAAHALLVQGVTPTVESAARAAHISRTTAYRYFSNQRELIAAALPEVGRDSLLSAEPPAQAQARVDLVVRAAIAFTIEWEPLLRASLRLSLDPDGERPPLRGGRAIAWYLDALEPLKREHPEVDRRRLAIAIPLGDRDRIAGVAGRRRRPQPRGGCRHDARVCARVVPRGNRGLSPS